MNIPFGYVYRITNKTTGESYVGQRRLSLDKYWRQYLGSGRLVREAIILQGKENFIKSLLGYAYDQETLNLLEEVSIAYEKDILNRGEYNQTRIVNDPHVASKIGAEVASKKLKEANDKNYDDFILRNTEDRLFSLFKEKPTDILLANTLNESLSMVKRWMKENELDNSLLFSGQIKSKLRIVKNEKTSKALKKMWADPAMREKIKKSQKGRVFSDEHKANLSKSHTRIPRVEKKCLWCESYFLPKKSSVQFCSVSCSSYARHRGIRK